MEAEYIFEIKYGSRVYGYVSACTKWHAFDKVYWRMAFDIPNIDRSKIKVNKK
jgi:hypothetical protein